MYLWLITTTGVYECGFFLTRKQAVFQIIVVIIIIIIIMCIIIRLASLNYKVVYRFEGLVQFDH